MPEASAPGKLILVGEYAVLEGAPAIAMAVNARAHANVELATGDEHLLIDPVAGGALSFRIDRGGRVRWSAGSPGARGTVVEAVFLTLASEPGLWPAAPSPLELRLDSGAFHDEMGGTFAKLGLGSSAAVLVALAGAVLAAWAVAPTQPALLRICCTAHRVLQGGAGSGVDVVTALHGGIVGVWPHSPEPAPAVTDLSWPAGLHVLPVWTGTSASTPDLLARYEAYRARDAVAFQAHVTGLAALAAGAMSAWQAGDVRGVLAALRAYDESLQGLDRDGDIGIFSPAHRAVRRLCARNGALYKVSGAGGGDFGLAWSDSAEVIRAVRREALAKGYRVLDWADAVAGLVVNDHRY